MSELQRYGIEWTGPKTPICVAKDDGYWTPWHVAQAELAALRAEVERRHGIGGELIIARRERDEARNELAALRAERDAIQASRDTQAALTREVLADFKDSVASAQKAEAERDGWKALAQLGVWCLDESRQNDCSDIDGGSLQDKAIELGLLAYVDVAEPCNEACHCLEYEGSDGFPTRCLRYTDRAVLDIDR